jgi:thioredoxin-related protein
MKKNLPFQNIVILLIVFTFIVSCARKNYTAANFEEKTVDHRTVAIVPAEMIFTGKQPKDLTEEDIIRMEEQESRDFQYALYNSILRHANTRKYITTVNFQDIGTTLKKMEENNIDIRKSWKMSDEELAAKLGVDAIIKMRIQKQRYMSDAASYGIDAARRVLGNTGFGSKIPLPYNASKTNDIYASCNLVSENQTLWNDHYKRASDWDTPANVIIEGITDNFGKNFPYKKKRK